METIVSLMYSSKYFLFALRVYRLLINIPVLGKLITKLQFWNLRRKLLQIIIFLLPINM